jgi:hypothetical protein
VAAVGFHQSIDILYDHLLDPILARPLLQRVVLVPLLLVAVGLIVGVLLDRVVPFARVSGIPEVKAAYLFGPGPRLSLRTVIGKFVLGALTIASGFSMEEVIGDLNQRLVGGRPSLLVPTYSLGDWREIFAYALMGRSPASSPRCSSVDFLSCDASSAITSACLCGRGTLGVLANQLWSYASMANYFTNSVNQMFFQPFATLQLKHAVSLTFTSEETYNWEASSGQRSTMPIQVFLAKVTRLGPFPFQIEGGGGYFVARPDSAEHRMARLNFVLILPRKKT